ncbi:MFS transporter [Pseudomonas syringae group genomosp. 3]|uniref:MFS transporter n=1 Tax=Pseudomonas syringae group genomosp. 3 TaxID=251701 RepID=UPI001604C723|nr:MFS transporter [Pseudomonas syringae group genomosp. 3]
MRASFAQGVLASIAFALLLAGTNAITPLLPMYRGALGFTPLLLSLTMVSYVSMLVAVLLFLSWKSVAKWSPQLLCGALLGSIASDMLLASSSELGILAGRAIAGIAGGLGTGAAAALAVAAMGAKGRSLSATGNLAGAVVGTSFSQVCVSYLHELAMHYVFFLHAGACSIMLLFLVPVLISQRQVNSKLLQTNLVPKGSVSAAYPLLPLLIGSLVWAVLTVTVVFLPSFFKAKGMILATNVGVIVLFISCFIGQISSAKISKVLPEFSGILLACLGLTVMLLGSMMSMSLVALLGLALAGAGTGISYRLCLIVFTLGASPSMQGKLASRYAAITYGVSASLVLAAGIIGNQVGLDYIVFAIYAAFIIGLLLLSRRSPRLRDTFEVATA